MTLNVPIKARQETTSGTTANNASTGSNGDERMLGYISEVLDANIILGAGDYKKANKVYSGIIKRYSDISKCTYAYYGRALSSYKRGKWKAAIKDFEIVLDDSEFDGTDRRQCDRLLADAKQRREEQLERRGEMWAGLLQVGMTTAVSVISAKEAAKSQKTSSTSSSLSGYSSSSYGEDDDGGGSSVTSSSSGKKECGFCHGNGYTIDYVATYGINNEKYCDDCKRTVPAGHYHKDCKYCDKGYR